MNKDLVNKLKKEVGIIGILFIVFLIVFKIVFYKEGFIVILRTVFSLFWLFVIPGFSLMYYWHDKLDFPERFVIGTALGLAINGILSYHLGLLGLNIKYHGILLPILLLIVAFAIIFLKKEKD